MSTFPERLTALTPTLQRLARHIALYSPDLDPDDIFQTMCLRLLERTSKEPGFIDRPDPELITFCNWRARSAACSNRSYRHHVQSCDDDSLELQSPKLPSPESTLLHKDALEAIRRVLDTLNDYDRQIVLLAFDGFKWTEIASRFHVSRGAISHHRKHIQQAFQAIYQPA